MQSLDWLSCLDPEAVHALGQRSQASLALEAHAVIFLSDLLEFGRVKLPGVGRLAVNWGDGSPIEFYGPGDNAFDLANVHYFSKNGQYNVLLAVTMGSRAPQFYRLILQVRNESGEVNVMHPVGCD